MSTSTNNGHGFGTLPVFLAGISTILGAVMFLRFGYAVGHIGLLGTIGVIFLGHMVTIPTALAIAEIATNRKVEGGGEYFIISRSFGTTIGSVIGLSLYLSQAISVAFYMIAFAEAFRPLAPQIVAMTGYLFDPRWVSVPGTLLLVLLILTRGADIGVKALYLVVAVLGMSLLSFFAGGPVEGFENEGLKISATVASPDRFFLVFAICFPAFTGMTAGVGLSGDLANPRKSIPEGTLTATLAGLVIYAFIVVKLARSAPPEVLADPNTLVMAEIGLVGWMIPVGLGCACLSSALGSILVAPRTLQALATDATIPLPRTNAWLSQGVGRLNEPRNATLVTGGLALVICLMGNVDFVARLISMFFMVTYGALCAISFLEHLAARPSYRPVFRSRWYISLTGAMMCLFTMFQMDPGYAIISIGVMVGLYVAISYSREDETDDLAAMFKGVMTQTTRFLQLAIQRREDPVESEEWRPSVIMVSPHTFERRAPLQLLRWMCHRYGFGTYLHFIPGNLTRTSWHEAGRLKERLISLGETQASTVYMDTIVSPSMLSALAQSIQMTGVSGTPNNAALFEFSTHDEEAAIDDVVQMCRFTHTTGMSLLVLRHGDYQFGECRQIHIWLTWNDRYNANLMVLLGYILLGHRDWGGAEIVVYAALPEDQLDERQSEFETLISEGRLPISEKNIRFLATESAEEFRGLVAERSSDADLVIMGFDIQGLTERGTKLFENHPSVRALLFVSGDHEIAIS